MLTLILFTSLTQVLSLPEQEFNLTLPQEFTTTTPEPFEDSSGDDSGFSPIPKKGKGKFGKKGKNKFGKKGYTSSNSTSQSLEVSTQNTSTKYLMASGISLTCAGLILVLYKIRNRRSGYQKIEHENVNSYGTW